MVYVYKKENKLVTGKCILKLTAYKYEHSFNYYICKIQHGKEDEYVKGKRFY